MERIAGNIVPLIQLEDRLLSYFSENPNRVISRDELLSQNWGPGVSVAVVEKAISRFRDKIESDPRRPLRIISVRGQGYMFRTESQAPEEPNTTYAKTVILSPSMSF
ncbi:MAG: winged helix-turn-helix domain-containing protein [Candidatus Levybacteria bacterium]|nr:winged helix-turn-helix domain-containing protein [Candidatus Levybacteria bacterium]